MGCDIHSFVEVKKEGKWVRVEDKLFEFFEGNKTSEPFGWRSYGMFGFLANIRNYSRVPYLSEPRGLPEDSEYLNSKGYYESTIYKDLYSYDYHSHSYLILKELLDFNYDNTFEDRRTTIQTSSNSWNGARLSEESKGEIVTFREFLGKGFFDDLEVLKSLGNPENVRIVFYFDN